MRNLMCLIAVLITLVGCKTKTVFVPQVKTLEITKTLHERDTTIQIERDSSWYKAWIECQNGKPVLKNPTGNSGKNLLKPTVNLDSSGQLIVGCISENIQLKLRIRELETVINEKEIQTVEVERQLTLFQKLYIILGKTFGAVLIGLVLYGAFKLFKRYGR
ncbi:hypothetical protein [Sphingobacterium sp. UBA6308]|uniref:hypothetical protein n=1 Tax=Sphingobacterium TaxID=28453 RepID=UPI00257E9EB9|nr:hypothetical protein [Sphingobacterium sp. UBA6308]